MKELLAVGIQVFAFVYIASTGPLVPSENTFLHLLFLAGLVLIASAIWVMRGEEWYVPTLHKKAKLVTWGPYTAIRHPMYLGLLAVTGSMVVAAPSPDRWLAYGLLVADLWYKISFEEAALAKRFPAYKSYMKKTKRLIPYLL